MPGIKGINPYSIIKLGPWRRGQKLSFIQTGSSLPANFSYMVDASSSVKIIPHILFEITEGLNSDSRNLIIKAFEKADSAFSGMKRKSGRPFIDHLVDTAHILRTVMEIKDPVLLAAGLLHDILEDTSTPYAELEKDFGKEVADLVDAETKLSKQRMQGERREFENLKRWIKAIANDPRVALLKAADNASNMRDQEVFPEAKRIEHALETSEIYIPIMEAMGVWEMREMLGNAAIRYLRPKEYLLALPVYQSALQKTEGLFDDLKVGIEKALRKKGIRSPKVELRCRSLYEVFRKMDKTKKSLEELLAENPLMLNYISVEIGGYKYSECYRSMGILRAEILHREQQALAGFKPRNEQVTDWIGVPRPDNYRAQQTYFFKEGTRGELLVAISTHQLNTENRLGLAAFGGAEPLEKDWYQKNFDWLKKLFNYIKRVSSAREVRSLIREMTYRTNFYTEKGEKIELPIGSTVLDFAFAKDPTRALNAVKARLNGKMVDLSETMDYGSVVGIIYQPEEAIEPIWLSWVRTTEAAEKVKQSLQGKETLWHIQKGKKSIDDAAAEYFLRWDDLERASWSNDFIAGLEQKLGLKIRDHMELVQKVGQGEIDPTEMVKLFMDYYQNEILQAREKEPDKYLRNFKVSVEVPNEPGILSKITDAIKTLQINVESDVSYPEKSGGSVVKLVLSIYSSIQRDQVLNILRGIETEMKKADKLFSVRKYENITKDDLRKFIETLSQT